MRLATGFLLLWALLPGSLQALDAAKEYEIKAAFLFNLGAFISWPENTFKDARSSFDICVLGQDPFGERLDIISEGQRIDDYPVKLHRLNNYKDNELEICEVMFISDSETLRLGKILERVAHRPVLTVGDMEDFVLRGGMVQFFPRDDRIRLMLDPSAFHEVGLKPSAHLMNIAELINWEAR